MQSHGIHKGCILTLVLSLTLPAFIASAETLTFSTYYPAPYGGYKSLRLYPYSSAGPDTICANEGELNYYQDNLDPSQNKLLVCTQASGFLRWQPLGETGWNTDGNLLFTKNTINYVGIGTSTPSVELEIVGGLKTTTTETSSVKATSLETASFKMLTGAQNGYVLMVDANGEATWKPNEPGSSFSNKITLNTPGTYGFTIPSDVTQVMVEVWSGGGGGAGGTSLYASGCMSPCAVSGSNGGNSNFGSAIVAYGGKGGNSTGSGGAGGTTLGADVSTPGNSGSNNSGSTGGTTGIGGNGAGNGGIGGNGGTSGVFGGCNNIPPEHGGGGGGGGAYGKSVFTVTPGNVYTIAVGAGGGLGAGGCSACGCGTAGTNGTNGKVIYYY